MRDVSGLLGDVLGRLDDSHDAIRSSAVATAQRLCPLLPPHDSLDPSHSRVRQWVQLLELHADGAADGSQLRLDIQQLCDSLALYGDTADSQNL